MRETIAPQGETLSFAHITSFDLMANLYQAFQPVENTITTNLLTVREANYLLQYISDKIVYGEKIILSFN